MTAKLDPDRLDTLERLARDAQGKCGYGEVPPSGCEVCRAASALEAELRDPATILALVAAARERDELEAAAMADELHRTLADEKAKTRAAEKDRDELEAALKREQERRGLWRERIAQRLYAAVHGYVRIHDQANVQRAIDGALSLPTDEESP